jgi:hypothetical protein
MKASEESTFQRALDSNWQAGRYAWGLHFVEQAVTYVGVVEDHQRQTFLAKFVRDPHQPLWHGYPANHVNNTQDIPDQEVLNLWLKFSILRPEKISKLSKGRPCKP